MNQHWTKPRPRAFTHAAIIVADIAWQALASAQTVSSSRDGYYMCTQQGFPSDGLDVWVFERDKMLAGQPARQVQFAIAAPSIVSQPGGLNGPPPPQGTLNYSAT